MRRLVFAVLLFALCALPRLGLAVPITDTVTVAGFEWAQVDLFTSLSWFDIDAACGGGECADGAALKGFDLSGWTWATVDEVNGLFNHYIGRRALGPGPDAYFERFSAFAPMFVADGWRLFEGLTVVGRIALISGYTSESPNELGRVYRPRLTIPQFDRHSARTDWAETPFLLAGGAWLYRTATVPLPSTLLLLVAAGLCLITRRAHNN